MRVQFFQSKRCSTVKKVARSGVTFRWSSSWSSPAAARYTWQRHGLNLRIQHLLWLEQKTAARGPGADRIADPPAREMAASETPLSGTQENTRLGETTDNPTQETEVINAAHRRPGCPPTSS